MYFLVDKLTNEIKKILLATFYRIIGQKVTFDFRVEICFVFFIFFIESETIFQFLLAFIGHVQIFDFVSF